MATGSKSFTALCSWTSPGLEHNHTAERRKNKREIGCRNSKHLCGSSLKSTGFLKHSRALVWINTAISETEVCLPPSSFCR